MAQQIDTLPTDEAPVPDEGLYPNADQSEAAEAAAAPGADVARAPEDGNVGAAAAAASAPAADGSAPTGTLANP